MHSGDLLVHLLQQVGVDRVFGLPGGQTLPLYDAIKKCDNMTHIGVREERTAAYAAVAYARMTNKIGVCDATVGPGAAQFISGLGEAFNKSIPILAIFSDIPTGWEYLRDRGTAWQAFYQLDMVKPFVKWSGQVTSQEMLPDMLRTALVKAVSGRPGPVVLSIPADVFYAEWDGISPTISTDLGYFPRHRTIPEKAKLEQAARLIEEAEKPVMIAGGGAMTSGAEKIIQEMAEKLNIPVLQTLSGRGVLPDDHPMGVGLVGKLGKPSARGLLEEADLCLLVGNKSAENSSFEWVFPTENQRVIQIDIEEEEIGRIFRADVGLVGDAKATLNELCNHIRVENVEENILIARSTWVSNAKNEWVTFLREELTQHIDTNDQVLKPQEVMNELNKITTKEDIVISDASFSLGWTGVYYEQKTQGRRILNPIGIAGLGAGLQMAIGASVASPTNGRIFLIAGDGGFAYSLGELATLKKYNMKVTTIILDNENWGWVEFVNKMGFGNEYMELEEIQYATVAEGFGLAGFQARNLEELRQALQDSKEVDVSSIIHVKIPVWETPVLEHKEFLKNTKVTN